MPGIYADSYIIIVTLFLLCTTRVRREGFFLERGICPAVLWRLHSAILNLM